MNFISAQYIVFFLAVVVVYYAIPGRWRAAWLLAASLLFYASAGPIYVLQILLAAALTFFIGIRLEAAPAGSPHRRTLLTAGILFLVGNLLAFKYAEFFNDSLRSTFQALGLHYPVPPFQILLPIGISFYTFGLISYLVDIVRGAKAERRLDRLVLYATFFPKLVAGPIERAKTFLPQLQAPHAFNYALVVAGLQLILWGAFKKCVVADRIAPFVDRIYDAPHGHNGVEIAFATLLYSFQIYADFSGYTDIALGCALVLGFRLVPNFNRPYFATSIGDFWKRWHMSLTSWLTDYIYTPLTRSKFIRIKWYNLMLISIFVTFVASGFWHGARWTFVTWGALHGFYLVSAITLQKPWNTFARRTRLDRRPTLHRSVKVVITFTFVCLAYILFRASSMADAIYMFSRLPTGWEHAYHNFRAVVGDTTEQFVLAFFGIVIMMTPEILKGKLDFAHWLTSGPFWRRWSFYYAGAISIVLLGAFYDVNQHFIYFRF